ncbi:Ig-like domain-containing protein, partial [Bacillus cereus]|uniref:Ig-like domain-containing protein n=1 Tax=Bacillus cereus TaxID=1396 RepID=UPI000279D949
TPIVDVLPGKYNIVHAAETQAKYTVMDASNKWAGLKPVAPYADWYTEEDKGDYKRFVRAAKTPFPNQDMFYPITLGWDTYSGKQSTIEAKLRSINSGEMGLEWLRYVYRDGGYWTYRGTRITAMSAEVPTLGQWSIWKRAYSKDTNKTTLYLNGKKIHEYEGAQDYQYSNVIHNAPYYNNTAGVLDVGYVYASDGPILSSPTVKEVTDAQTTVTGSVNNPGATVTIESNGMPGKYKGTADDQGNFSIAIPKQKAGAELTVTQALDGSTSEKTVVTVKDGTAPDAPKVNPVTSQDTKVTGTGEKGAKAIVKIGNGEYEGTVDEKGNYAIDIPEQPVGTEL